MVDREGLDQSDCLLLRLTQTQTDCGLPNADADCRPIAPPHVGEVPSHAHAPQQTTVPLRPPVCTAKESYQSVRHRAQMTFVNGRHMRFCIARERPMR
jgi:hypothetical protein